MTEPDSTIPDRSKPEYTRRSALGAALGSVLAAVRGWWGEQPVQAAPSGFPEHITPQTQAAIKRGLKWLVSQQAADGGFGSRGSYARNVGVCALSGTAFLAHRGMTGAYRRSIQECIRYLLGQAQENGFIVEAEVRTHATLYGHGFATMFLGQVFGESFDPNVRAKLKAATELILNLQNEQGGWSYTSDPKDADVSITTCQMLALFSARQAGIGVPRAAIDGSVEFLRRAQNPDGGFRYRLDDPPESLFPRSAAAVVALTCAGLQDDEVVKRGRDYLQQPHPPQELSPGQLAEYHFYGRFYATHAAWQAGKPEWDRWYPTVRDELLSQQSPNGAWHDANIGDEYATAMALLVLQFPYGNVPLLAIR
ncbi:prenyltransferase/squalene oxidase repeat-containing protein [Gimesia algae]|uniref:Prenyltransferase and squalene oxidase repeat protein n=1 Tax=Gimesia algae TaxID=2527971 RepID=A0A517VAM9_9PLAN|nr:prenyltransferase/squalene oxidase repeat-containing protein [Gimesia algae]QDT90063.1 Prenyltransferase and squalene oxidase repeat protein [Gimesia algae]